ncbi:MAG: acyl-CoA dehydrogenase family protein [Chloroflexota bacterium]
MNVQFSETQEMLRTSAREFLAENSPASLTREMRDDPTGYSTTLWNALADLGWTGLCLPEAHGGSDMSLLDFCLLQEELGRACAPTPFIPTMAAAMAIARFGSAAQRSDVLPRVARGEAVVVAAVEHRRDAEGVEETVSATLRGDGFRLDGTVDFAPWANSAEAVLCPVTLGAEGQQRVMLVPTDATGVSLTPLRNAAGPHRLWRMELDSVSVERESVLPDSDEQAIEFTRTVLDAAHCCDTVGALTYVLEATVAYANERRQFGQTIGSFQVIQHYCADMHVMLEGLRMSAYKAAWSLDEHTSTSRDVVIASAYAHEVVPRILNLAHQIHGAMGVTYEHDLHLYTTRATPPAHDLLPLAAYLETMHAS